MSRYNRDLDNKLEIEWSPEFFGYMSVPIFIVGVIFFSFPDFVIKFVRFIAFRNMKPNYEFEEHIPERPIASTLIIILKILGLIMIALGTIWFWFAEQFYLFFL